jgi:hypothetical protein
MVKLDPKERPTLVINHIVCTTIFTEFVSLRRSKAENAEDSVVLFVSARKQDHLCLMLHTVIHVYNLQNSMVTNSNTKKLISTGLLKGNQISQQTPKYLQRTKSWHPKMNRSTTIVIP